MGNGIGKLTVCYTGAGTTAGDSRRRRKDMSTGMVIPDPLHDLGHSFCYIRPELNHLSSSKTNSETEEPQTTTFKSISGAAVSANTSTALSTAVLDFYSYNTIDRASAFEGSTSFASIPLHPIPRDFSIHSGPILNSGRIPNSGPIQRGFMSGPLEKGSFDQYHRSYSHGGLPFRTRSREMWLIRALRRALSISRGQSSIVAIKERDWIAGSEKLNELTVNSSVDSDDDSSENLNLQWAQGKAGEDRVHVVVSDEHGWVFVGIYDGFNGPDAPDYLLSNLYSSVHKELKGLLWDENESRVSDSSDSCATIECEKLKIGFNASGDRTKDVKKSWRNVESKKQRRWRCEWDRERLELERRINEQFSKNGTNRTNHGDVLKALSRALKKTEEGFLDLSDKMVMENPELALMGSCVLVMLMKGDDVYVMNVGDSRAVLGKTKEPDLWSQDLERISEETVYDLEVESSFIPSLSVVQLSMDHTTSIKEEVIRIKNEHPDDASAVINDRVKGSLKVTRALGAGFLKQPKWNDALLEMFRIEYIGTCSYINCLPSLYHHRLGPRDRFLILSSDGLYQYFTNEEAVSEVELFVSLSPEGDPAQHLAEELLFRAAKRAGMDFHELLEVPQGDRRRYHDDVSIIVISLEGRIWKSCA